MAAPDDVAYSINVNNEDLDVVLFNDDKLEVFETILGITMGSTFLIEYLSAISHQPIIDYHVAPEDYGDYFFGLVSFLLTSEHAADQTKPIVVILHWEGLGGAVHYVLWFGDDYIWDPFDIVQYPNADSWCQTCITAKLCDILIPYSNPELPWESLDWPTLGPIQRHIKLRNLAVYLLKFGLDVVSNKPSDSHGIIQDAIIEAQSDPPVNYFTLASFLLELELPRYKV